MRKVLGMVIAGLALLMVGCFEEKNTVTVYPSGAGTLRLHQKLGKETTDMLFFSAKDEASKTAVMEKQAYKLLGRWQGVAAWSEPSHRLEDGALTLEALGYFDQVSQLKMTEGKNTQSFSWTKTRNGGFRLAWIGSNDSEKQDILGEYDTDEKASMLKSTVGLFKDIYMEYAVVMPGDVGTCGGSTFQAGRSATRVLTDADLTNFMNAILDYRQRVADGKLTKDDANARLLKLQAGLALNLEVTCGPAKTAREFAQFQQGLNRARDDYAASGLAGKIKAASVPAD